MQIFQGFVLTRRAAPGTMFSAVGWLGLAVAAVFSFLPLTAARAAGSEDETIKAYVVVDDKSGHILAEHKATDKLQVASLTKIATAMVTLDWARTNEHALDQMVTIPEAALAAGGINPVGFLAGDEVSVRDLLYSALLQSDNVAAEAIGLHVGRALSADAGAPVEGGRNANGPSVQFVVQMNALAHHLGMERTRFLNPSGVDGKERPFSTAADLARLTRYALGKADFRFFVAQKERKITINRASVPTEYLLRNTNELLGVKNVDGVKTGQTRLAGSCLIITAARESLVQQEGTTTHVTPRRIIVVVLGAPDRFRDASRLLDRGVELYDQWVTAGHPSDPKQTL